jgi:hypothetical protein
MLESTGEGLGPTARTVPDANHSHVGQPVVRGSVTFGGQASAQDADAKWSHLPFPELLIGQPFMTS